MASCRRGLFLRLITHNIVHGGGNNINIVLRVMEQMKVDLGVLTETKLPHDKHTQHCQGHSIYSTKASPHQGGVALFYRQGKQWTVEGIKEFGPNVIRCSLVSGGHRWTVAGAHFPPSAGKH